MVLVPIMFRDNFMGDILRPPCRMLDDSFFGNVFPGNFMMAIDTVPAKQRCNRSNCALRDQPNRVAKQGDNGFQVSVDVQQFKPEEISVKMTDNYITVEGKHEEKQDEHDFVSRHFVRKYRLPQGHDAEKVVSSLSSDGVLTIKAPTLALPEPKEAERTIPVVQTGKPAKEIQLDGEAEKNSESEQKDSQHIAKK